MNSIRYDPHKYDNIENILGESNFKEPICNYLFANDSGVITHEKVWILTNNICILPLHKIIVLNIVWILISIDMMY